MTNSTDIFLTLDKFGNIIIPVKYREPRCTSCGRLATRMKVKTFTPLCKKCLSI